MVFLRELRAHLRRTHFAVRFLLVLMAALHGLMSYANIVSTSHAPPNGVGHDSQSMVATHAGGHDHVYDEPDDDGNRLGHHDVDHSHDTPNLLRRDTPAALKLQEIWDTDLRVLAYPTPYFSFERPPRQLPMS